MGHADIQTTLIYYVLQHISSTCIFHSAICTRLPVRWTHWSSKTGHRRRS